MNNSHFHPIADATLMKIHDQLEALYEQSIIEDLELEDGILNVVMESGQTFVVNKHEASQQIWLASPLSGGLHFTHQASDNRWALENGKNIEEVLYADINTICGRNVIS